MATTSPDRIQSLDIIRGIAVMGILSVNIVGMGMIESAYFYPPDYGFESLGDKIMWALNFIVVDGRFRSLFSILFGASTVLVIDRAVAAGRAGWKAHYPRMIVLLLFGLIHYYVFWWGDILANYALVGMVAFLFYRLSARWLLIAGILFLSGYYLPQIVFGTQEVARYEAMRAPDATPEQRKELDELLSEMGTSAQDIAEDKATHASILTHVEASTQGRAAMRPFNSVMGFGLETLGLMLLGMAAYKSGFLTGGWSRRAYARTALICIVPNLAYHLFATWLILRAEFDPFTYFPWDRMYSIVFHPIGAIGYAALFILLIPKMGALGTRLAAVGRAAFTNYLGSTLIGVVLFYQTGFGLYGDLTRGQLWLFVPVIWAVMLLWSQPWLATYRYGPLEWAWRSLSRGRWGPMRRSAEAA